MKLENQRKVWYNKIQLTTKEKNIMRNTMVRGTSNQPPKKTEEPEQNEENTK